MKRLLPAILALGTMLCSALAEQPLRLVTLGAAVTQTVAAFGIEEQIVGRDSSSLLPPSVLDRPDVGYFRSIGAEGILALRPTHVITAVGSGPAEQLELLRRSGVQVIEPGGAPGVESYLNLLNQIGALTRQAERAESMKRALLADLDEVRTLTAERARPTVVFLLGAAGGGQAQVAGRNTAAEALIELAGGRSVVTAHRGYRTLSAEAILALQPEVIVVGAAPDAGMEVPEWIRTNLPNTRRITVSMDDLTFGPDTGNAVRRLANALHGNPVHSTRVEP